MENDQKLEPYRREVWFRFCNSYIQQKILGEYGDEKNI